MFMPVHIDSIYSNVVMIFITRVLVALVMCVLCRRIISISGIPFFFSLPEIVNIMIPFLPIVIDIEMFCFRIQFVKFNTNIHCIWLVQDIIHVLVSVKFV